MVVTKNFKTIILLILLLLSILIYRLIKEPIIISNPFWSGYEVAANEYFPKSVLLNPTKKMFFDNIRQKAYEYCDNLNQKSYFDQRPQIISCKEDNGYFWILFCNNNKYVVVVYQLEKDEVCMIYFR